jgi:hypothetical protein
VGLNSSNHKNSRKQKTKKRRRSPMLFLHHFSKVPRDLKVLQVQKLQVVHRLSISIKIPEKEEKTCLRILSLLANIS